MPFDPELIAGNLRGLRHKAGLTQAELSEALSIPRAAISNYEKGVAVPTYERAWAIADFYKVSLDALGGRNAIVD